MNFAGFRFDRFDLRPSHRTDEGFLICEAAVAKEGILPYRMDDGSIRKEFVPRETLGRRSDLGTLGFKPVTKGHPDRPLDPSNVRKDMVGSVGSEVEFSEANGLVTVKMALHDEDAIEAAESGERDETSPGYKVATDETPGTYKGEKYDAVQTARRYNHFATCEQARAGADIGVRVDSMAKRLSGFRSDEAGGDWSIGMMDNDFSEDERADRSDTRIVVTEDIGDEGDDTDGDAGETRHDDTNWRLVDAFELAIDMAEMKGRDESDIVEDIAECCGESKAMTTLILNGKSEPDDEFLAAVAKVTGFDIDALRAAKLEGERCDDDGDVRQDQQYLGVNNPGELEIASLDRGWDKQRALESLYSYYDVDPSEDDPPDAWHSNFLYVEQGAGDSFTSGHNYLVVEAIDGERKIVPAAIEAAQQFLVSNPGLPGNIAGDVRNMVTRQWNRIYEKHGDDWIDPDPVWNRDDSRDDSHTPGHRNMIAKILRRHVDKFLDANQNATEADVVSKVATQTGADQSTVWQYLTGAKAGDKSVLQAFDDVLPGDVKGDLESEADVEFGGAGDEPDDTDNTDTGGSAMDVTVEQIKQAVSEAMATDAMESHLEDARQRYDQEGVDLPPELEDMREEIQEKKEQKKQIQKELDQLKSQIQGMLKSLDMDLVGTESGESDESGQMTEGTNNMRENEQDSADGGINFDSEDEVREYLNERRELESLAERFAIDSISDKNNTTLKREIVAAAYDDDPEEWRDDSHLVEGAFEGVKRKIKKRDDSYDRAGRQLDDRRDQGGSNDLEQKEREAQESYLDDLTS